MPDGRFHLYVLCATAALTRKWETLAEFYHDLDVNPLVTVSAIETIRQLATLEERPFLVCRDTMWLGRGMSTHAELLIEELNGRFPNWALCGNRGMRWDGQRLYDYSYDMSSGGLQTATCAHPVISLDDGVLLVNPSVLNGHKALAPPLKHHRPGVLLSLECLQNGSVMAVSPHLLAMRTGGSEIDDEEALDTDPGFREYYRASFLNHHCATPDGMLDLSEIVDYRYVSEPWAPAAQQDILELYDQSLEASRAVVRPSVTICCRTQFLRLEMLERAVLSFAAFRQHTCPLVHVEVRLITDASLDAVAPEVRRLQQTHPGAALECWYHEIRPNRYSRTDLLLAAVERAGTDYIWFIDDDDYVNAATGPALARSLVAGAPLVIVASSSVIKETWDAGNEAPGRGAPGAQGLELTHAENSPSYQATHIFRILKGLNFVPICSMILPVALMQDRISKVRALGDYNEDYFLLLLALTASRVEVCLLDCELSSVSIRGDENTVTQKDRSGWHLSLATFLLEIMNNTEGNSPFLWQIANTPQW
jgi:hypothetical protein